MAPVSRRTVLAALAAAPALAAVGCGGGGAPPAGGGGRDHRPLRDGLDAQHQPHRALRRAAAGLVHRRRAGRADPAVQLDVAGHARVARAPPSSASRSRTRSRSRRPRARTSSRCWRCCSTGAPAIGVRADRADISSPARPRRQDLRRVRRGRTRCRRCRRSSARRAGRATSRPSCSAPRRTRPLYAGQVDFTEPFLAWEGIEARAAERAAQDVRLRRLRLPRRLQRDRHRQPGRG